MRRRVHNTDPDRFITRKASGAYRIRIRFAAGGRTAKRDAVLAAESSIKYVRKHRDQLEGAAWAELGTPEAEEATPGEGPATLAEASPEMTPERRAKLANKKRDLKKWLAPFGARAPRSITAAELDRHLEAWIHGEAAGTGKGTGGRPLAPSTVNKYRQELCWLYDDLAIHPNPARQKLGGRSLRRPGEEAAPTLETEHRGQPLWLLKLILAEIPDYIPTKPGKPRRPHVGRARLAVLATTGLPPIMVMRLSPTALKASIRTIEVARRKKGKGTELPAPLSLTDEAVTALKRFYALRLAGKRFSLGSMSKLFKRAIAAARARYEETNGAHTWPAPGDLRVYDLRHSFLTEVMLHTGDAQAVQTLALHSEKSPELVRRYTKAAESARAAAARDAVNAGFAGLLGTGEAPGAVLTFTPKGSHG